jgi:hypothetical protein
MSAASVMVSMASLQGAGSGSSPRAALHSIVIKPIPFVIARDLIEQNHYLHSLPGGTMLCFGTFQGERLMGVVILGAGPYLAYHLVDGADRNDCLVLTRVWLSDQLPANSESRILGVITRLIRGNTDVKFLVSYADPAAGHVGIIYQSVGWLYIGLSSVMSLYDLGDGIARHSRSVAHDLGSHSLRYLAEHGVNLKLVAQSAKHRYLKFLDESWRSRLTTPVLRYPKKEAMK